MKGYAAGERRGTRVIAKAKERNETREGKGNLLSYISFLFSFINHSCIPFCVVVFHASEGRGKERCRGG